MNIDEFKKILENYLSEVEVEVNQKQIENLYAYMQNILEWNTRINLTAITEEDLFIVKHFVDSLSINKFCRDAQKIIDIGTGAGFPGIPLAIINEKVDFTLIDSINKKLNVIKDINSKIKLENIDIIHSRAEDLAHKVEYRECFDVATTRAVSNLTTILEYMLPFIKIGGKAICMKGPNYKEELKDAEKAIKILGGELKRIESIGIDELERNIIIIEKKGKTPEKFPRGQGKPLREPIR